MKQYFWELRGYLVSSGMTFLGMFGLITFLRNLQGTVNEYETLYQSLFYALQVFFSLAQSEHMNIKDRKVNWHRFNRSMPKAWEKELGRFLRIDGTCLGIAVVSLVVSIVLHRYHPEYKVAILPVLFFLCYMMIARLLATTVRFAWVIEIVLLGVIFFVPFTKVEPGIIVCILISFCTVQACVFRLMKKQWYSEKEA